MHRMMTFHRANEDAMTICNKGVSDYVASRCLLFNGQIAQGLTLASQAVEKVLKSQYVIRGGTKPLYGKKGLGHDVPKIASELRNEPSISFDLSRYDTLFNRLIVNYDLRYPNNWDRRGLMNWSQSTDEIHEMDELFLHLFDNFPVPREVNILTCYFGVVSRHLATPDNAFLANDFKLMADQNQTIDANWSRIKSDCDAMNLSVAPEAG